MTVNRNFKHPSRVVLQAEQKAPAFLRIPVVLRFRVALAYEAKGGPLGTWHIHTQAADSKRLNLIYAHRDRETPFHLVIL